MLEFGSRKNKIRTRSKTEKTKKYSNPFFKKRRKKISFKLNLSPYLKVILITIFVTIFSSVWMFSFSDYFDIKKIAVEDGERVLAEDIKKYVKNQTAAKRFVFFPQKKIFFFNTRELSNFLILKHSFEDLKIKKKYPDKIEIEFNEKTHALTWKEDDNYFYIDAQGYIINEANLLELNEREHPLVDNNSSRKIEDNHIGVDNDYLQKILLINQILQEHKKEFDAEKFIIDDVMNTIKVQMANGPQVYFSTILELEKQFRKLLIVKNEKIRDGFSSLEYINLKIGDSVYYQ